MGKAMGKAKGEAKGSREGRIGQGGRGRAVRGRWAPPPMKGKGQREGQRMAIGR